MWFLGAADRKKTGASPLHPAPERASLSRHERIPNIEKYEIPPVSLARLLTHSIAIICIDEVYDLDAAIFNIRALNYRDFGNVEKTVFPK